MQYFGVPKCPYCKKRVNIIRVWSLKKHGEFKCPRCEGISNIYLSPLVYVAAVLAIACGFLIYFFERFITNSVTPMTCLKVFIPFAAFFLLSLFFVYLEKPVIRRVRRTADGRFIDENGNEMKMKMGKLVSPSNPNQSNVNRSVQNTGYVRNDSDMTGRIDPKPVRRAETPERVQKQTNSGDFYTNSNFADDEELYAQAAARRRSDFPESSRIKSLSNSDFDRQPVSETRSTVRRDADGTRRVSSTERPVQQRPAEPRTAQPRSEQATAPRTRQTVQSRTAPVAQSRVDNYGEPIRAGRIASQRSEGTKRPNSGFEDIIDTYSTQQISEIPRRPRTAAQTAERTEKTRSAEGRYRAESNEKTKKSSTGRRFRDL